jgi:hypothetical protein
MGNLIIYVQLTLLMYHINEDEIGGICNISGRCKKCNIILMIDLIRTIPFVRIGVHGRLMLKLILEKEI